jgi:FKBP-type peptidyl-prolyl cis-trans isomerase
MKKMFAAAVLLTVTVCAMAQTGTTKPATKPVTKPTAKTATPTKPVTPGGGLKTLKDSVSYAAGVGAANYLISYYKEQGGFDIDPTIAAAALKELLEGKQGKMDNQTCGTVLNRAFMMEQEKKSKPILEEGKQFLAQNKNKPGVKTTPSGLQYEVITEGTGVKPAAADTFVCHYRGTLLNGTQFDASYDRGEPLKLGVSQVIRGWTEGLQLMPVGSKYKFYIPNELGYGPMGQGQIPGGAMLVFEVELLDVVKAGHQ